MYNVSRCNYYMGHCDICKAENGYCDNEQYKEEERRRLENRVSKWDEEHPLCKHSCPMSLHPEFCSDIDRCPHFN